MGTQDDYLELAVAFERAAKKTPDPEARQQLQTIAGTYVTLAKSERILEQSADVVDRLKHFRKA